MVMTFVYILFGIYFGFFVILKIVEPIYIRLHKRPLFLHWNPFLFGFESNLKLVSILEKEFIFYRNLESRQKIYFEKRVDKFIQNYSFVGKEILVNYEMKALIAATYVVLTFGMRNYRTTMFNTIIIYPSTYYSTINDTYHKGEFNPRMKLIVFSWDDFLSGHKVKDNINLGLHEFTHALLFHALKSKDASAMIFHEEFNFVVKYFDNQDFLNALRVKNYFRAYAYTNKFEFLAVLLEHFFETPNVFKSEFPELFERLKRMLNYKEIQ